MPEACAQLGDRAVYAASIEDCLAQSTAVIITNPLPELRGADWSRARGPVLDCWRCLPSEAIAQIGCYVPLGAAPEGDVAARLREMMGDEFDSLTG